MSHEIRTPTTFWILGYLSLITLLRLEEPDRQNAQRDIDGSRTGSGRRGSDRDRSQPVADAGGE